jgi:hypothetical protein
LCTIGIELKDLNRLRTLPLKRILPKRMCLSWTINNHNMKDLNRLGVLPWDPVLLKSKCLPLPWTINIMLKDLNRRRTLPWTIDDKLKVAISLRILSLNRVLQMHQCLL